MNVEFGLPFSTLFIPLLSQPRRACDDIAVVCGNADLRDERTCFVGGKDALYFFFARDGREDTEPLGFEPRMLVARFACGAGGDLRCVFRTVCGRSAKIPGVRPDDFRLACVFRPVVNEVRLIIFLMCLNENSAGAVVDERHIRVRRVDGRIRSFRKVIPHCEAMISSGRDRKTVLPHATVGSRAHLAESASVFGNREITHNDEFLPVSRGGIHFPQNFIEGKRLALRNQMTVEFA